MQGGRGCAEAVNFSSTSCDYICTSPRPRFRAVAGQKQQVKLLSNGYGRVYEQEGRTVSMVDMCFEAGWQRIASLPT